jgi:molybdopterin converting factor small subunit
MVTLTLSAPLAALLPENKNNRRNGRCSITIDANNWTEAVNEIHLKFERLASHMFDESSQLRPGLLVAVNDDVNSHGDDYPRINPGDEVFLFTQIAGG